MPTIEFYAEMADGVIKVPEELQSAEPERVKVILTRQDNAPRGPSLLKQLLENPIPCPGFVPLTREEANAR